MNARIESFGAGLCPAESPAPLDALADAAVHGGLVSATLRGGRTIRDGVRDLFPACGTHIVVFHANNAMFVDDVVHCEPVRCVAEGEVEA